MINTTLGLSLKCKKFLVAWLMVELSQGPQRLIAPVSALWFFAVPLLDTVFLMIHRKQAGRSMVVADRRHLHHAFLRSGFGVNATLLCVVLLAMAMAGAGIVMEILAAPEYWRFYAFMLVSGVYYRLMSRTWANRLFLGRAIT